MLYITIFISLILLSYQYDYLNRSKGKWISYSIVWLVFILVAGLRYRLGIDSIRYESGYTTLPSLSELSSFDFSSARYDPAYIALNAIARSISDKFVIMQLIESVYVNSVVFWFFRKYTKKIFFAILLYFVTLYFPYTFEVLREACAAATFLIGWKYFLNKDWTKYYILSILCTMFHTSGFVTLLLPLLYLPGIRRFFTIGYKTIFILIGIIILGGLINIWLFDYIQAITFIEGIQEKAAVYQQGELSGSLVSYKGAIIIAMRYIIYPFLCFMIIKHQSKLKPNKFDKKYGAFELMLTMCFIFVALSIPITIFYRYNNYFFPFAIVAICNLIYSPIRIKSIYRNFSFGIWFVLFIPCFFFNIYNLFLKYPDDSCLYDAMRYYPYSSILYPEKDEGRERLFIYHNAF